MLDATKIARKQIVRIRDFINQKVIRCCVISDNSESSVCAIDRVIAA